MYYSVSLRGVVGVFKFGLSQASCFPISLTKLILLNPQFETQHMFTYFSIHFSFLCIFTARYLL